MESNIFKDISVLDPNYLPKLLPYRENQQKYIAECIKPLFEGINGTNLFISGHPGIGKTACIKYIFRDLREETGDIIPIYVNCWKKDTTHKIALHISNEISLKTIEKTSGQLLEEISKVFNKLKGVVLCFDEVDKVQDLDFLYYFLEEINRKCVFLITNNKEWIAKLDARIKSRLMLRFIDFQPYNLEETKGILKERMKYAFFDVFEENAFDKIAEKTFISKDIRTGLFLLRESGRLAESINSSKIKPDHVNKILEQTQIKTPEKQETKITDFKEASKFR